MENRNSILLDFQVEPVDELTGRRVAIAMADERLPGTRRITLGGDKGYDTRDLCVPVARSRLLLTWRRTMRGAAGPRSTRAPRVTRLRISQRIRTRVEEAFGWMKTIGGLRKTRYHGRGRVQMHAYLVAAAYNLIRIAHLETAPA
jgi:IS5 family transposase